MESKIRRADIHDASFSAYLNTKTEIGDINVFGAEKYFNVKFDNESPKFSCINSDGSKQGLLKEPELRCKSRPRSRSVAAESVASVSDVSSQTGLLPNSQGKQKKTPQRFLWTRFACNGSCSDKNSTCAGKEVNKQVDHDEKISKQTIQVSSNTVRLDGSKKPRRTSFDNSLIVKKATKNKEEEELEVFGSKTIKKDDMAWYLERKMSMLTWDAIPKTRNLLTNNSSTTGDLDSDDDGSSDLFEIDNLSVKSPYQPSETSIQWSVATASAADFSDYYDMKMAGRVADRPAKMNSVNEKEVQKNRSNSLMGCKSQKAVEVATDNFAPKQKFAEAAELKR